MMLKKIYYLLTASLFFHSVLFGSYPKSYYDLAHIQNTYYKNKLPMQVTADTQIVKVDHGISDFDIFLNTEQNITESGQQAYLSPLLEQLSKEYCNVEHFNYFMREERIQVNFYFSSRGKLFHQSSLDFDTCKRLNQTK